AAYALADIAFDEHDIGAHAPGASAPYTWPPVALPRCEPLLPLLPERGEASQGTARRPERLSPGSGATACRALPHMVFLLPRHAPPLGGVAGCVTGGHSPATPHPPRDPPQRSGEPEQERGQRLHRVAFLSLVGDSMTYCSLPLGDPPCVRREEYARRGL